MKQLLLVVLTLGLVQAPILARAAHAPDYAGNIASLIEPAKLATLKFSGANPRIQKCVYWLEEARLAGQNTTDTAHAAVSKAGYRNTAAVLTEQSLLRNLDIATKLGCLDKEGLAKMRRGGSPIVRKGPTLGTWPAWTISSLAPSCPNWIRRRQVGATSAASERKPRTRQSGLGNAIWRESSTRQGC
jgi:hypothetical protein